jgi:tellurite resistance protein TehA-like permease
MLAISIAIFSVIWALWLTYLIRYPTEWRDHLDRLHVRLKGYGLSIPWMKRAEQGITLKVLIAATTVISLACLAIVLRHPDALDTFLHHRPAP